MEGENIHQRIHKLKDVALGSKKAVSVSSSLAPASYDSAVDSLLALYCECKSASSLAKDKNVLKFIKKYECTISALEELRVCADDFEVKTIIGRGHFAEVVLTREKSTGDVFAMKTMKKAHILQQPDAAFYSAERDIMAWSTSPWLTSLHYAFQDPTSLYLVMDYHPGGDLLNIMERKEGCMRDDEARFYLAEIAAGLHDLHELGFVHRDVKPENVLIACSGHIKLVDFGSAARLDSSGRVIESRLPVGTPEYISPEVLTSLDRTADYGVCCDWWSLGIIAYELLYETTPFEGDSTSKTYSNIMSYKKCLAFPEGLEEGSEKGDAKDLITKLLTDMRTRLAFPGIQTHPFFSGISWNHLLNTTPPHIPTVSGPDDVSNFDVFEPCKDNDLKYPDLPSKSTGFVGRSLPFIGFTFTAPVSSAEYFTDGVITTESDNVEGVQSGELAKAVELANKELGEERKKRISLERECAVYQSQLEDFYRKLEMEKSDRRVSESRALQLLQEVKEKGKLAQQLREDQARTTEVEYGVVVEQLEQERQEASRRSQRLQEKLKELQKERDAALKKGSEYKAKLAETKEGCRKDMAGLQTKLTKVSKESGSKVEEIRERYAEALKKKNLAETAKKKTEMELRKLKSSVETRNTATEDLSRKLKETRANYEHLQDQLKNQEKANEFLERSSTSYSEQFKKLEEQLDEAQTGSKVLESEKLELDQKVCDLQLQLDEVRRERKTLATNGSKASLDLKAKNLELKKLKEENSKLEMRLSETKTLREISHKTNTDEKLKKRVEGLEREKLELKRDLSAAHSELKSQNRENKSLTEKSEAAEKNHKEAVTKLQAEMRTLQVEVKEKESAAVQEDKKMRELKKAQRELKQQNTKLGTKLSIAQSEAEKLEQQARESRGEMEVLRGVQDNLKMEESKASALQTDNESTRKEILQAQEEIRELKASRNKAEESLNSVQKWLGAKELDTALLQRNVRSLKEELAEAKATAEDAQEQQKRCKTLKETVEEDLETAEAKLEDAYATIEMEKRARLTTEQRMSVVAGDMQRQLITHAEELQSFSNQLLVQKELATKYSVKMLEVEQEARLKALSLKETQKELSTEKAVSSKFYDEVQLKSRELNKLKATHMKLLKEMQQVSTEVSQQKQTLNQQGVLNAEHQLQETRLQATIAQQGKLIDYLQGVGRSPEAKGLGRLKGLKLGRKGRDPAREIAEWNKLKGIAGKGNSSSVTQSTSSRAVSGLPTHQLSAETSSTLTSPPRTLSPHTTTSSTDPGLPSEVGDSAMEHSSSTTPALHRDAVITSTPLPRLQPLTTAVGAKRKASEVTSSHTATESTAVVSKQISGHHNIPHVFRGISKSGIRSNYSCAACKGPIKTLQKLIKCSHCHIPCHAQCIDNISNNCGLTEELSAYMEPASKRQKHDPPQATAATPSQSSNAHQEAAHQEAGKKSNKSTKKKKDVEASKATSGSGVIAVLEPVQFVGKGTGKKSAKKAKSQVQLTKVTQLSSEDGSMDATDGQQELGNAAIQSPPKAGKEVTLLQVSKVTSSSSADEEKRHALDSNRAVKCVKNIYTGFEASKVIRMERTSQPRGGMMTEGWLVLTLDSLCLYDRDPRGVTRKPIHRIMLNEPGVAYIVIASVGRHTFPHTSPVNLMKAFGMQVYSSRQSKELCFLAASLQSKIDWVEAIQKVLGEHVYPPVKEEDMSHHQAPPSGSKGSGSRELKAVSIVPLATSPLKESANGETARPGSNQSIPVLSGSMRCGNTSDGSTLDLSIRSSMLNSSSDSSFI